MAGKGSGANPKNYHVTPRPDGWAVIREGADRASRVVPTQSEAIRAARDAARQSQGEMFIHGENGQIRERNTYGKDPNPPKG